MYKKISALLFLTIGQLGAASWSMVLPDNFSNELEELLIDIPQEPYSSTSASSSSGQSDGQAEKKAMPKRVRFKYDILPDVSGTKPFPSDGAATAYTLAEFHEAKDQEDLAEKMESLRSTRRAQRCTNRMQGNIEKRLIELGRSSGVSTTQEIDAILGKNVPRKMRIDVAKEMNRAVGTILILYLLSMDRAEEEIKQTRGDLGKLIALHPEVIEPVFLYSLVKRYLQENDEIIDWDIVDTLAPSSF